MTDKAPRKTYFAIAPVARTPKSGVFVDVKMPGGQLVKVMDEKVYERASRGADEQIKQLLRGKRAPSAA